MVAPCLNLSRAAGDIRQITGIGQLERVKFFSKDWQPIEERDFVFDTTSPLYTSVYGLGYVDDLVERNQYYDTLSGAAMNDRLWVQQDQNHDVTSIANDSAVVQERFVYDPYKKFTVLDGSWVNAVDAKDWASLGQGMRWEKEAGLYEDRNRFYSPSLQRFVSQDPKGTVDGASLYQLERSNPTSNVDPTGYAGETTQPADEKLKYVTLDLSPSKPDSMGWNERNLRKFGPGTRGLTTVGDEKDANGKTKTTFDDQHTSYTNPEIIPTIVEESAKCWRIHAKIIVNQHIYIDPNVVILERDRDKTYGHEQLHVKNNISVAKTVAKSWDDILKKDKYESEEKAIQHRDIVAGSILEDLQKGMSNGHDEKKFPDGPRDREGYPPIGTRPKDPSPK